MKTRTSIQAGGSGCSPETQAYMQKAISAQAKLDQCIANQGYTAPPSQPTTGYYPPNYSGYYPPSYTGSTYPDMSGYCG